MIIYIKNNHLGTSKKKNHFPSNLYGSFYRNTCGSLGEPCEVISVRQSYHNSTSVSLWLHRNTEKMFCIIFIKNYNCMIKKRLYNHFLYRLIFKFSLYILSTKFTRSVAPPLLIYLKYSMK